METEPARTLNVMMARAKIVYSLIIKVYNLFPFSRRLVNEIENMYSLFLSSYRNTRKSAEELEKAVETPARGSSAHSISRFPKLPLVYLYLDTNTVQFFLFIKRYMVTPKIQHKRNLY